MARNKGSVMCLKLRNPHDLLIYLVELSDSDRAWMLNVGRDLYEAARADGRAEWSESEFAQFAQYLWKLEADGSVTFEDHAARTMPGDLPHRRAPYAGLTYNDLSQAANITVTSQGRIAAQTARPTLEINVANIDMAILFNRMEEEIEALDAPEDAKDEARSKLRAARPLLVGVGSGTTADVLAAVLRRALHLP